MSSKTAHLIVATIAVGTALCSTACTTTSESTTAVQYDAYDRACKESVNVRYHPVPGDTFDYSMSEGVPVVEISDYRNQSDDLAGNAAKVIVTGKDACVAVFGSVSNIDLTVTGERATIVFQSAPSATVNFRAIGTKSRIVIKDLPTDATLASVKYLRDRIGDSDLYSLHGEVI